MHLIGNDSGLYIEIKNKQIKFMVHALAICVVKLLTYRSV